MKKLLAFIGALLLIGTIGPGCATVRTPVGGSYYTQVKHPLESAGAGVRLKNAKMGKASASSILGAVAFGDCSIERAAANGEITEISHVDHESFSILGFYASFTTIVYGN